MYWSSDGCSSDLTVEAAGGGPEHKIDWPGCTADDGMAIMRVADAGLAIEAAANGLGRASVPLLLAEKDIAEGRVRQIGERRKSSRAYWLIAPLPQWRQKKVKALVEALTAE